MRKILLMILILNSFVLLAQNYSRQIDLGVELNHRGGLPAGVFFRYQKINPTYSHIFHGFRFEFNKIKHYKESSRPITASGNYYYEGKQNNLLSLRPQYVQSFFLFNKTSENGVFINLEFGIGPSIGVVNPYLVKYVDEKSILTIAKYNAQKKDEITGDMGYLYSLGQADWQLGMNGYGAVDIQSARTQSLYWGVQLGYKLEYYPKGVFLYPTEKKDKLFPFLFMTFYTGLRK